MRVGCRPDWNSDLVEDRILSAMLTIILQNEKKNTVLISEYLTNKTPVDYTTGDIKMRLLESRLCFLGQFLRLSQRRATRA